MPYEDWAYKCPDPVRLNRRGAAEYRLKRKNERLSPHRDNHNTVYGQRARAYRLLQRESFTVRGLFPILVAGERAVCL